VHFVCYWHKAEIFETEFQCPLSGVEWTAAVNTRFLGRGSGIHRSKERQDVGHYLVEMFVEEEVARIWI